MRALIVVQFVTVVLAVAAVLWFDTRIEDMAMRVDTLEYLVYGLGPKDRLPL